MNRINKLFAEKEQDILSVYFTAGYPAIDSTREVLLELVKNGVDIIEIGMPFSDPIADGPVIQKSSLQALNNGMTLKKLFEQLKDIRNEIDIPLIAMGYLNPVLQFGLEKFCQHCKDVGIDGLILPDLPVDLYLEEYKDIFQQYGLHNIFLVTPLTSEERVRLIDQETSGFIYLVSSASTTGARKDIQENQIRYFERINAMKLSNPTLIGFGISNHETFSRACKYAHGAIIGSAFIHALDEGEKSLKEKIQRFVKSIKT
ncbi:MAG: tryptophan synthase subunit alpha [Bacteroidetes bacterium]|jgi:tryptophan synthase alpha chain|nr:tryptophan synthase subunit alpha [Bacteroidota bacterium]